MLELRNVTLCCIDTRDHLLALRALERSRSSVRFAKTLFFTDRADSGFPIPQDVTVHIIPTIASLADYSHFVLKQLLSYVDTEHVLVTQWDGYVTSPHVWNDAFLACDYLGAPWPAREGPRLVGNGGFSLRSRKLLQALQDPRIQATENEDVTICLANREYLQSAHGISFGSPELADQFSFELQLPRQPTFGFHGVFNFAFVEGSEALAVLAPQLDDRLLRDQFVEFLLRNCEIARKWLPIVEIGNRMLELDPSRQVIAGLVKRAREALASPA